MSLNAVNSMKTSFMLGLLLCAFATPSLAQQKTFDWVRASDETAQLDPADYHTGRIYRGLTVETYMSALRRSSR